MTPDPHPRADFSEQAQLVPKDHIPVARISAPWGLKGAVKIESLTDVKDRLAIGGIVFLNNVEARITDKRKSGGICVLQFDIIPDRNAAEALRGFYLTVPLTAVPPAPTGTYYYYQLIGLNVRTESYIALGKVCQILETGANDVLVVRNSENKETLLPILGDVILNVDLVAGCITVRMPEYV